jgi:NAD(P)-dependent dehydrogenase (short-subunit alcohol dehydrogenase family)
MDPITFDGRVAVVTGAGGGLGRSYALELARRGARVVVNDLGGAMDGTGGNHNPADLVVQAIRDEGGEAVASYDSVAFRGVGESVIETALEAFGTVDILINNAGNLRDRSFANLTVDELDAVVDVHLLGAFHVTQPAFRVMKEKGYGRILFTSSSAGLFGNFGQSNYSAAKMGVVGLSNVVALEGARYGITSNVIAPMAKSRLTVDALGQQADLLDPDLVTPLALFLVSEASDLTHEIFSAAGGRYASVFVGLTQGWTTERGAIPTLEDVRAHLGDICDRAGYMVPGSCPEELAIILKAVS